MTDLEKERFEFHQQYPAHFKRIRWTGWLSDGVVTKNLLRCGGTIEHVKNEVAADSEQGKKWYCWNCEGELSDAIWNFGSDGLPVKVPRSLMAKRKSEWNLFRELAPQEVK